MKLLHKRIGGKDSNLILIDHRFYKQPKMAVFFMTSKNFQKKSSSYLQK